MTLFSSDEAALLVSKVRNGERIARAEAEWLQQRAGIHQLGTLADRRRSKMHPIKVVTFVVDRNVNYTNVCTTGCKFCAFYRNADDADAYLLSHAQVIDKVAELAGTGGTQLLLQGGLHPDIGLSWFEELFQQIRREYPDVQIHSLSPAEIVHLAQLEGIDSVEVLARLHQAGLKSLPGGGAEILDDEVRQLISPKKIGWREWAGVMRQAQELGMKTTATMMFGAGESDRHILDHLFRIRDIQDEHMGFTAFIPWTYQPGNTELGGKAATAQEYLRVVALSRLILDNVENIQASWVTQGDQIAQLALRFGANDMGGTMLEENVVAAAGVDFRLSQEKIITLIEGAGFRAAQRTTEYEILKEF